MRGASRGPGRVDTPSIPLDYTPALRYDSPGARGSQSSFQRNDGRSWESAWGCRIFHDSLSAIEGRVAQVVEHLPCKQRVPSSTLGRSTFGAYVSGRRHGLGP